MSLSVLNTSLNYASGINLSGTEFEILNSIKSLNFSIKVTVDSILVNNNFLLVAQGKAKAFNTNIQIKELPTQKFIALQKLICESLKKIEGSLKAEKTAVKNKEAALEKISKSTKQLQSLASDKQKLLDQLAKIRSQKSSASSTNSNS